MDLPNLSALRIASASTGGAFVTRTEEGVDSDSVQWHPWLVPVEDGLKTTPTIEIGAEVDGTGGNPVYRFTDRWEVAHTNPKIGVAVSSKERGLGLYAADDFAKNEFVAFFTGQYMYEEDVDAMFPQEACVLNYNMKWEDSVVEASATDSKRPMYCRKLVCVPRMSANKSSAIDPEQMLAACNLQVGREGSLVDVGALLNASTTPNCYADAMCLRDERFVDFPAARDVVFDRPAIAIYTMEAIARGSELTVSYGWDVRPDAANAGSGARNTGDPGTSSNPAAPSSNSNPVRTPSTAGPSRSESATPPPAKQKRKRASLLMPARKPRLAQRPNPNEGLRGNVPRECIVDLNVNLEFSRRVGFKAEASLTYVRTQQASGLKFLSARNPIMIDKLCGPPLIVLSVDDGSTKRAAYICFEPLVPSEKQQRRQDDILKHDESEDLQEMYAWGPISGIQEWWKKRMYQWESNLPDGAAFFNLGVSSITTPDPLEYWRSLLGYMEYNPYLESE